MDQGIVLTVAAFVAIPTTPFAVPVTPTTLIGLCRKDVGNVPV